MPFMQPQVTEKQKWIMVDGPEGTEYLPIDLWAKQEMQNIIAEIQAEETNNKLILKLIEYTRNQTFFESKVIHGFGARLSAPGYMDCTDWCVFDTEKEARKYIEEMYEVCSYCGEEFSFDDFEICPYCENKYLT